MGNNYMIIKSISIQNFRKLKSVNIDISKETTVFVGANNSGKTSAMLALQYFLTDTKNFSILDITLTNWKELNDIGSSIENTTLQDEKFKSDISNKLLSLLPSLDIWFKVEEADIHHVIPIIPTLNWTQGILGVRIIYQPTDLNKLIDKFLTDRNKALKRREAELQESPKNFTEFLDKNIKDLFALKTYKLDPSKYNDEKPQELPLHSAPIEDSNILKKIIRVDFLDAQPIDDNNPICLSDQLRSYYDTHLNPSSKEIDPANEDHKDDITALKTLEKAAASFDENLSIKFSPAFKELKSLGYPNIDSPLIEMNSKFDSTDAINHRSAMQYNIPSDSLLKLPETYSGLGYRNLISIVFRLMAYRDAWMLVGNKEEDNTTHIPPIHLVIVEEPEAHLHAQVQQVFIKKAYERLRNNDRIRKDPEAFTSHLLISTHSSHIAHETAFSNLRYFKKEKVDINNNIPLTNIINLTDTFGNDQETEKFVTRYLKLTHSDILFADALIIVEGQAERILVPYFIENNDQFKVLTENYITLLEMGGSHSHRLIPLVNKLGLTSLIISDLDSVDKDKNYKTIQPTKDESATNIVSSNETLKMFHYKEVYLTKNHERVAIYDLLTNKDKVIQFPNSKAKIIFAHQFDVESASEDEKFKDGIYLARTFEDDLILKNIDQFKDLEGEIFKEIKDIINNSADLSTLNKNVFELIHGKIIIDQDGKEKRQKPTLEKAEFALELLLCGGNISTPKYIEEGLLTLIAEMEKL